MIFSKSHYSILRLELFTRKLRSVSRVCGLKWQSQKAVSAYFTSKQILPFGFITLIVRGVLVTLNACHIRCCGLKTPTYYELRISPMCFIVHIIKIISDL